MINLTLQNLKPANKADKLLDKLTKDKSKDQQYCKCGNIKMDESDFCKDCI